MLLRIVAIKATLVRGEANLLYLLPKIMGRLRMEFKIVVVNSSNSQSSKNKMNLYLLLECLRRNILIIYRLKLKKKIDI